MADGSYERSNPDAVCGCHNCGRIFRFKEIEDFWDAGETPVCPGCGMDTVVVETADMSITPERLSDLRKRF